jgi:hypothetical protein
MRPRDTSPEAWKVLMDIHRRMPPGEKIARAYEYSDNLRRMNAAVIRQQYPNATEHEVFLRVTRNWLGPELFRKAYGDVLPDERERV